MTRLGKCMTDNTFYYNFSHSWQEFWNICLPYTIKGGKQTEEFCGVSRIRMYPCDDAWLAPYRLCSNEPHFYRVRRERSLSSASVPVTDSTEQLHIHTAQTLLFLCLSLWAIDPSSVHVTGSCRDNTYFMANVYFKTFPVNFFLFISVFSYLLPFLLKENTGLGCGVKIMLKKKKHSQKARTHRFHHWRFHAELPLKPTPVLIL